jgi:hypothetical protein
MTDLNEILPITTAFNPDFISFRKAFDRCIEELEINAGDYEFRMKNQINKKFMGIVLCELKSYMNTKMETNYHYYDNKKEPVYSGKCYEYKYILRQNDRIQQAIHWNSGLRFKGRMDFEERNSIFTINTGNCYYSSKKKEMIEVKPEELVKARVLNKTMDYKLTPTHYCNATFLKKYNNAGKTSNKGLTAIHFYKYENNSVVNVDNKDRGGWQLNGLTAGSLRAFVMQNGFKFEKDKKYTYGDYANWVLHTLN